MAQRLQSSGRLGDSNGMIDTNVSRAAWTSAAELCRDPIIVSEGRAPGVFLETINGSSHSSQQDVLASICRLGGHADPSWHISVGVFLLWFWDMEASSSGQTEVGASGWSHQNLRRTAEPGGLCTQVSVIWVHFKVSGIFSSFSNNLNYKMAKLDFINISCS